MAKKEKYLDPITIEEVDQTLDIPLTDQDRKLIADAKRRGLAKVNKKRRDYISGQLSQGIDLEDIIIPKQFR